jgi:hypothetical protein
VPIRAPEPGATRELRAQLVRWHLVDRLDLYDVARVIDEADGAIVRADELTGALEDAREERLELSFSPDRLDDRLEAFLLTSDVFEPGHSPSPRTSGVRECRHGPASWKKRDDNANVPVSGQTRNEASYGLEGGTPVRSGQDRFRE